MLSDGIKAFAAVAQGVGLGKQAKGVKRAARQQALEQEAEGLQRSKKERDVTRRVMATQLTRLAASGGGASAGSPLLLLSETARQGELNAALQTYAGFKAARETRTAGNFKSHSLTQQAGASYLEAFAMLAKMGENAAGGGAPAPITYRTGSTVPGGYP
ncbi:MAG: hypothetical protein AAGJ85_01405 [Pseudomonadota bacterium]